MTRSLIIERLRDWSYGAFLNETDTSCVAIGSTEEEAREKGERELQRRAKQEAAPPRLSKELVEKCVDIAQEECDRYEIDGINTWRMVDRILKVALASVPQPPPAPDAQPKHIDRIRIPQSFPVTDDQLDAPDGAEVLVRYKRVGSAWEKLDEALADGQRDRELIEKGVRAGLEEAAEMAWACNGKYIRALDAAAIAEKVLNKT